MKLPGFLTPLGLQIAAGAVVLVAVIALLGGGHFFSPGTLSAGDPASNTVLGGVVSHAQLGSNCAACHAAPWTGQSMNGLCLSCHVDIQAELQDATSLHGLLQGTNCTDCHTEHRGPTGYLTSLVSLEVDHNQFGFSLVKHQQTADNRPFTCGDCHTENLTTFEQNQCEDCHRTFDEPFVTNHVQQFGADCRACHNGEDIFSPERFDHNLLTFPLLGKHSDVQCVDCHVNVTSLAGFQDVPTTCVGCHLLDNPHPANFGTNCAACHNTEGWETEIFDHDLAAFKLTGKHINVPCADCHVDKIYRGTPTSCVDCHAKDDVHLGQFGIDCAACHTTDGWERGPFEHTFPLDHGGQGIISCTTCHTVPDNYQAYTCSNCHDPDEMRRVHSFAEMMNTDITDCARCHPTGQSTGIMH